MNFLALLQEHKVLVGIVGAGLMLLYKFSPSLLPLLSGVKLANVFAKKPLTRAEAQAHINAAFDYFKHIKCDEGMAAMKVANSHVFDHGEPA